MYEYFASTLPSFAFGAPPPMAPEELLAAAQTCLAAADSAALGALLSGAPSGHPFVVAWRDRDAQLRNAVARARAAKARGAADASRWLRPHGGWSGAVESGVAAAFQEPDPLRRERALARLRWDQAGELAGLDPFSAAAVLAYAVRLQIAETLAKADEAAGLERLRNAALPHAAGE
ncbi:MAG: DUF2764 family protein [Kiritimatiellae bacterium]|nr:DUF2764 family protein [Kiritimatiellia bacterium]